MLGSAEAVLKHADLYGLDRERASLLERLNRINEAAELHLENDNLTEAVRLLTSSSSGLECADRIAQTFVGSFWEVTSLGYVSTSKGRLLQQRQMAQQLLQYNKFSTVTRNLVCHRPFNFDTALIPLTIAGTPTRADLM